jgi:hypothetical protein
MFVFMLAAGLWQATPGLGQQPVSVNQEFDGELFGRSMSFLRDETGQLTIHDIAASEVQVQFEPLPADSPRFGIMTDTIWLKLQLQNSADAAVSLYLESAYPLLDYLHLYSPNHQGGFDVQKLGDRNPYNNRRVKDRHSVFALEVPPGTTTYFVEVRTKGSANIPIKFWTPDNFIQHAKQEYQIIGLILGFLLVMLLYNLFLAISFRSKTYLIYGLYILSFFMYELGMLGVGMEWLPGDLNVNFIQNTGLLASAQGANFFGSLFTIFFMDLRQRMPRTWRAFLPICTMNGLLIIAVMIFGYNTMTKVVTGMSGLTAISLILLGVINIVKGYRPAVFFTLAWIGILIGNVATALSVGGIIPVNFFTTWSQSFGAAAEVVLLSLALGDRVNYIRTQHENKIKSLNKDLEHHIEHIEEIVAEKTRDIKSIMSHIEQGIFTIHPDPSGESIGIVGDDYSAYLNRLLGESDISQKSVMELVFAKTDLSNDAQNRIVEVLRASLDDDELNFMANKDNLATEFRLHKGEKGEKIIEVDWNAVVNEKTDLVDKILVTLRDITHIRRLQAEARLQQEELEYIAEILNVEVKKFNRFIEIAYKYIEENNRLIERSQGRNSEILKILFINMHTMKGMARSYNLTKLTELLHNVEKYYALLQRDPNEPWDKAKLEDDMRQVAEMFDRYNSLNINKLNRGTEKNRVSLEKSFISQKIGLLNKLDMGQLAAADQGIIQETRQAFAGIFYEDATKVFDEICSVADPLSRDLGKEMPVISVDNPGFSFTDDAVDILQNVFTHVIRNSIDHGLETAAEREQKGKPAKGQIKIELTGEGDRLAINYADDGGGLNLKRLRELAIERNLLTAAEQDDPLAVAYTIFMDGLSTAPKVTEISGRGVGMGAVKRYLEDAGGAFHLYFIGTPDVDSTGAGFGIRLSLPPSFFSYSAEPGAA